MIKDLLANNMRWADHIKQIDPAYFPNLSKQQSPKYLWIGCSDSRVPANEIVGMQPGQIFVHRNVANLVIHTDFNFLSVLQYAVDVLKVEHIIVCGHYGCGGVEAALNNLQLGIIDNWLQNIKDIQQRHASRFENLSHQEKSDLLCELNVIEQANNVSETTIVQQAWGRGQKLFVHGWIYSIADGLIRDLQVSRGENSR
ncbi:MAG: carbonate dehydratase [Pseudomonadales bacterium]|nr:carbonate dehydratase [Pseudomonadales bacterium]MCP5215634.1 carbonate dehydratase [Pseudomonadales bacterium]